MVELFTQRHLISEASKKCEKVIRLRGAGKRKKGGKNLCSLHECVTNKSSFSMTNYYKKGEKWGNIAEEKKRVRMSIQWRKGKDWKSKPSHFYWAETSTRDIKSIEYSAWVGNINLIFSPFAHSSSLQLFRKPFSLPRTQIATHFSSSSGEIFYGKISFFIARKNDFSAFSGRS